VAVPARPAGRPRPPVLLITAASAVALAAVSPVAYIVIRLSEAGGSAFDLLFNARTLETLLRTAGLALAVTLAACALALPLAWLTTRTDLPLRRLWAVLTALPLVIPSYVYAFTFVEAFGPVGLVQQALAEVFGLRRLPEIYGFPGAAMVLTLLTYPYALLGARAALAGMDPALEETSRSLGKGPFATFLRVTLPQLRPALLAGGLLIALYTLSDFGAVTLLRFRSFTNVIYLQYEAAFDRTLAAASSLVLVLLALVLVLGESAARGPGRYHASAPGSARRPRPARLGAWRWPAVGLCAAVTGAALFLPVAVLAYWGVRGLGAGESFAPVWDAALNSLGVSLLAAGATVAAALPVAVLGVRYAGRLSWLLERGAYFGFALPGIVVALALVFFGIRFAPGLYQTTALLVGAYVILFLPAALGALRTRLLQLNPHTEEAARSLGRAPQEVFLTITLPLVGPGVAAAAALVFLVTMKELPATLILGPIGFKTLATSTWSASAAALQAQAAFPALALIAAAALPMAAILYWERRREW
jgi:iron(III) transport system permease protein